MDSREAKALEIAARCRLTFAEGVWQVPSQSGNGKYRVELKPDAPTCTCEDFTLRQQPCKHITAARLVQERDHGGQAPAIDTDTIPKKPTYKQSWPAYNEAQTHEKHRLQVLLHELCQGVSEERRPRPKGGRPKTLLGDAIFAAVFKIYSTVSSRRFMCDLNDAHAKGYLSKPLHYNSINGYLEDDTLTPALCALIIRSSLPLKAVETDFAVDSTGFTTSRFVKWFDHKYGVTRQEHDWVKAHFATGVRTNIITAVKIEGRDANDSPMLPPLMTETKKNFDVKEVSADKGYISAENIEAVFALGAMPYIPFKTNATGGAGGLFEKMFHYYSFNREEFLRHYHKRSNIESTVNMVKAKFRDHVRSRTDVAMKNEVLCKILCHNLCVLIQSQCELGIEVVFWGEKPAEERVILPMIQPG